MRDVVRCFPDSTAPYLQKIKEDKIMTVLIQNKTLSVKEICEEEWDGHKADCSGFVKAVAHRLGLLLSGQANDIMRHLRSNWNRAAHGKDASEKAAAGWLVVAGLEARPNGHVVVVVPGPLNRGKYPTAYWGRLGRSGSKNQTINWSWSQSDIEMVAYYYTSFAGGLISGGMPNRITQWGLDNSKRRNVT